MRDDRPRVLEIPRPLRRSSHLERAFDELIELGRFPPAVPEYRFWPGRRFALDRAYPEARIAFEMEGGIFGKGGRFGSERGAHAAVGGILRDVEKYNEAQLRGWRVYRITAKSIGDGTAFVLVYRALEEAGLIERRPPEDVLATAALYRRMRRRQARGK